MKWWVVIFVLMAGCERPERFNQMEDHGRVKPYEPVGFESTGQSARPVPAGTISRDQGLDDPSVSDNRLGSQTTFPFPVTHQLILRGRQRFEIFCAPCHGLAGDGNGMIVQRGLVPPPSFHIDRLRASPPGHFVDVITNGWGAMFSYNDRINPEDRWAIAAYIRVLQFSQHAPLTLLSADDRRSIPSGGNP